MLLPKGGINWKAARAQLPPTRAIWVLFTRSRFLLLIAVLGIVLLLWRGISSSASEMHRLDRPHQSEFHASPGGRNTDSNRAPV